MKDVRIHGYLLKAQGSASIRFGKHCLRACLSYRNLRLPIPSEKQIYKCAWCSWSWISQQIPVHNSAPQQEGIWQSDHISPCIFNLKTRWRHIMNITSWPLSSRDRDPQHPLNRKQGWPQRQSGCFSEDKVVKGIDTRSVGIEPIAQSLYLFSYPNSNALCE